MKRLNNIEDIYVSSNDLSPNELSKITVEDFKIKALYDPFVDGSAIKELNGYSIVRAGPQNLTPQVVFDDAIGNLVCIPRASFVKAFEFGIDAPVEYETNNILLGVNLLPDEEKITGFKLTVENINRFIPIEMETSFTDLGPVLLDQASFDGADVYLLSEKTSILDKSGETAWSTLTWIEVILDKAISLDKFNWTYIKSTPIFFSLIMGQPSKITSAKILINDLEFDFYAKDFYYKFLETYVKGYEGLFTISDLALWWKSYEVISYSAQIAIDGSKNNFPFIDYGLSLTLNELEKIHKLLVPVKEKQKSPLYRAQISDLLTRSGVSANEFWSSQKDLSSRIKDYRTYYVHSHELVELTQAGFEETYFIYKASNWILICALLRFSGINKKTINSLKKLTKFKKEILERKPAKLGLGEIPKNVNEDGYKIHYHILPDRNTEQCTYEIIDCPYGSMDEHFSNPENLLKAFNKWESSNSWGKFIRREPSSEDEL